MVRSPATPGARPSVNPHQCAQEWRGVDTPRPCQLQRSPSFDLDHPQQRTDAHETECWRPPDNGGVYAKPSSSMGLSATEIQHMPVLERNRLAVGLGRTTSRKSRSPICDIQQQALYFC